MARVKLLTIHWGLSYGAIMQTYATCKMLELHGHDVSVVNLIHPQFKRYYTNIRAFFLMFMNFQFWLFKCRYFSKLTRKIYEIGPNTLSNDCDYIVVGSDQVWNRALTSPLNLAFFVNFNEDAQKVSLSSSFGKSHWDEDELYTRQVRGLLSKFSAISVRENSGATILSENFNLHSTVLIDPTLAYANYENLILDEKEKNCIYTFFVTQNERNKTIAKRISSDLSIPLFKHSKFSYYFKNGPRNWLTYIKKSRLVITDSFHGLVFSLIFRKPFIVLCSDENKFTRLQNLLNMIGLENRFVKSIEDYESRKEELKGAIEWDLVDKILDEERLRYNMFIRDWIK